MAKLFRNIPLSDMGPGRATSQFVLSHGWYTPVPSVGEPMARNAFDPHWTAMPLNAEDAAGAVIGARSGLWVPVHDQAPGRYGIDSKKVNRNDRERTAAEEDDWIW